MKTKTALKKKRSCGFQKFIILIPFVWLLLFFALPIIEIIEVSFSFSKRAIPPYEMFWKIEKGIFSFDPNLKNYKLLWIEKKNFFIPLLNSFKLSINSSLLCLMLGYPIALWIANSTNKIKIIMIIFILLPFWTSSLIKVYAIMNFLGKNGILNDILIQLRIIDSPLDLMRTDVSVYYGMIIIYLPLMVLPLLASLSKIDKNLYETSSDLGANSLIQFTTITLPLSFSGIISGFLLVFIPSFGEFIIPELLGGVDQMMIGKLLWNEFFKSRDWPYASALAVVLLLLITIPIAFLRSIFNKEGYL